jgi:hypothetical protein
VRASIASRNARPLGLAGRTVKVVWMELRELGARARVHDADGEDLGVVHLPWPVDPTDALVWLEQAFPRLANRL